MIVTENKQDFPQEVMDQYGIEIQGADEFLCDQIDLFGPRDTSGRDVCDGGL